MSGLGRREFVALLGGAATAWPIAARAALASEASGQRGDSILRAPDTRPEPGSSARAQPERIRRIGVLITFPADDLEGRTRLAAFMQALQQLGWTDGRNVRIDIRWGDLNADIRKDRKSTRLNSSHL